MQVAVDMHDLHLQERCFHAWLKYNQEQQEIISEKMAKADDHFCKLVVTDYSHFIFFIIGLITLQNLLLFAE